MRAQEKRRIFLDCLKIYRLSSFLYAAGIIVGEGIAIYSASVLGRFSDSVLSGDFSLGVGYIREIVVCVAVTVAVPGLLSTLGETSMFRASLRHSLIVLKRYLGKTYESALQVGESEIQYRLEDDLTDLGITWTNLVIKGMAFPVVTGYLLYSSYAVCGWYTLAIFAVSMVKLFVPMIAGKSLARLDKKRREYQEKIRFAESGLIDHPEALCLYGMQDGMLKRLEKVFCKYRDGLFRRTVRYESCVERLLAGLDMFCILCILLAGSVGVAAGSLSMGAVASMTGYYHVFNMVTGYADYMIRNIPKYRNLTGRILVFYENQEEDTGRRAAALSPIVMEGVGFCFQGKEVFRGISAKIGENKKIAVAGQNGSGKTTLLKILCGLYPGYSGRIWGGGSELRELSAQDWRRQCAFVEQEPFLFEGTVRENVALGNVKASAEEMDAVMVQTGILQLADRKIGAGHEALSGGERQKIAIARALLKDSRILLLDEPGNHLDDRTRTWLEKFIKECSRTIIFVSHDQRLQALADVVLHV